MEKPPLQKYTKRSPNKCKMTFPMPFIYDVPDALEQKISNSSNYIKPKKQANWIYLSIHLYTSEKN